MYMSKNVHVLSRTLFAATGIHILGTLARGIVRMCIRDDSGLPDMANDTIWNLQLIIETVMLLLTIVVFWYARRRMHYYMDLVDDADKKEMGRLQEDQLGENLSALPARTILNLTEVWAVIFIGMRMVQEVASILYRRFAGDLFALFTKGIVNKKRRLVSIYNTTHGFKYIAMMCAILLGVMVTAIILHDKWMKIASVIVAIIFLGSFAFLYMQKMQMFGQSIGIVWTSVIFHVIETVGLVAVAIYLRWKYRGV